MDLGRNRSEGDPKFLIAEKFLLGDGHQCHPFFTLSVMHIRLGIFPPVPGRWKKVRGKREEAAVCPPEGWKLGRD